MAFLTEKQINLPLSHHIAKSGGDLPAVVEGSYTAWYKKGFVHRDGDLPDIIDTNRKIRCQNGQIHRDSDKPAIIMYKYGINMENVTGKVDYLP